MLEHARDLEQMTHLTEALQPSIELLPKARRKERFCISDTLRVRQELVRGEARVGLWGVYLPESTYHLPIIYVATQQ
jgi:hypothetical protein